MENLQTRLIPLMWVRGPAEITGEYVVLDKERADPPYRLSDAKAAESMAFEFAAIAFPDPTDKDAFANKVRAFVRRYGLLWHGAGDIEASEFKEPLDAWFGESVTLGFMGSLYQKITVAVSEKITPGSAKPVQNFLNRYRITLPQVRPEDPRFDHNYILEASRLLQEQLNNGMQGRNEARCEWGLFAIAPGDFQLIQCAPDLLSHIYATFAVLMANKVPMRTCPGCGRFFTPKDVRQKWHAPGCGSTKRGQKRRAKMRGE